MRISDCRLRIIEDYRRDQGIENTACLPRLRSIDSAGPVPVDRGMKELNEGPPAGVAGGGTEKSRKVK